MNLKKLFVTDSSYLALLQKVRDYPNEEIEKAIQTIQHEYPVLLIDRYSPVAIYILDYKNRNYAYISKSVESIIGYKQEDFYKHGIAFTFALMHPDDFALITDKLTKKFLQSIATIPKDALKNYRFSWNYRAERSDGVYVHILQQITVALVDEHKNPVIHIGSVTDISSIKNDNSIVFSLSKYDWDRKLFTEVDSTYFGSLSPLSERELQVLKSIASQMDNKQIAKLYNISVDTVRAHRRNIHKKTECNKMSAVIAKAHREGWL